MIFGNPVVFVVLLFVTNPQIQGWEDIQEGDCLTTAELQKLSGVRDPSLYNNEKCGEEHIGSAQVFQQLSCGDSVHVGEWKREMKEHKEAGFFWPKPVPCTTSVTSLEQSFSVMEDVTDPIVCSEEPVEIFSQTESLTTERFSAGQGYLYLPNPMLIEARHYQDIGDETYQLCERTELNIKYTGMGKLEGSVARYDCDTGEVKLCLSAKLKASETDEGEMCALFQKISDCSEM
jgi:hypothetical protein